MSQDDRAVAAASKLEKMGLYALDGAFRANASAVTGEIWARTGSTERGPLILTVTVPMPRGTAARRLYREVQGLLDKHAHNPVAMLQSDEAFELACRGIIGATVMIPASSTELGGSWLIGSESDIDAAFPAYRLPVLVTLMSEVWKTLGFLSPPGLVGSAAIPRQPEASATMSETTSSSG